MNQAHGLQHSAQPVGANTLLWATAGGCLLFSHCFGRMLERDKKGNNSVETLFPYHRSLQAFDICLDGGRFPFQMGENGEGLS